MGACLVSANNVSVYANTIAKHVAQVSLVWICLLKSPSSASTSSSKRIVGDWAGVFVALLMQKLVEVKAPIDFTLEKRF